MDNQQPHGTSGVDYFEIARYLWLLVAGVFAWIFRQHLDEDKERARALSLVQQTYATRDDISDLHQKIDTNHRQLIDLLSRDR